MNNFYVYLYLDPTKKGIYEYDSYKFNYEPFYVGKGKNSRLKEHLFQTLKNSDNKQKTERILYIKKNFGKKPIIIKYKKNLIEKVAFDLEIDMILKIGRKILNEGPLLNIHPGGQGFAGWLPTENWCEKNRIAQKKRWKNPDNREKQSKTLKNVGQRKSFREKASKTTTERWKNTREEMISYQQREDVKKKKSLASIQTHSKTWILISPFGERFKTSRLKEFCKRYNLNPEMLQRVAMAKQLHHKNWLCFKDRKETETKEKLYLLKIERDETEKNRRKKLSIASTGRKKSEEEKRKISKAQIGNKNGLNYKHTPEAKEKIRQSSIKMWETRKKEED